MHGTGLFLDGVKLALGDRLLVEVSHHVQPGDVLTIMGSSGSGKSSLLAYIAGFLEPAFTVSGRALVDGVEVTALAPEERRAGILFQDPLLFPHMDVAANLMFALPENIKGRGQRRALAEAALEGIDLAGMGDRDPATLSGGQKARVALARVLLSEPRMLLLDEPFSRLDMELRQQMRMLVFGKARERGLPVLLVTHDEADAEAAGGDIVRIGS